MKKAYKYGIELEVIIDRDQVTRLSDKIRAGRLPYTIKHDGSVRSSDYEKQGIEIACSRPLNYTQLERSSKALCRILRDTEASINKTCGFHLHMSNKRFYNQKNLKKIVYTWSAVEDILYSTQPKSRYNNDFCKRVLQKYVGTGYSMPKAKSELIRELHAIDRYYSLNLSAMGRHGTLEVRLHAGTTNSEKVLKWVELVMAIYDYALTSFDNEKVTELFNMPISDEKIKKVFALLKLDDATAQHFTGRIERFGFDLLARQQAGAVAALKLKPQLDKAQKALAKARAVYASQTEAMSTQLQAFNEVIRS
jgi:hypothetical protein